MLVDRMEFESVALSDDELVASMAAQMAGQLAGNSVVQKVWLLEFC